ncbi:hypothetical protein RISW2_19065 [Roseivivax isoporae LMG 25204]|uniref:Outer membrane or secreted lipoprotein n=2 Tax=Roseivivax TaxID=93682 RepID=X7F210_9RHOB|nr:hypothetical protein RISW2_19065 [Roseivivax isoporae LMG 25204]
MRGPKVHSPGDRKTLWRTTLETGSRAFQDTAPLADFDIYVVGFHCARHAPHMHMEAHHYCRQVNSEVLHCVIFDGNTRDANLIGIEYIISGALFDGLPEAEKAYWHPHNYEVLSGQLSAPGLPESAEHALVALLVNSYGKTWHTWHTGRADGHGRPGDPLPYGDAQLMWSFNRDGEVDPRLKEEVNTSMGIDEMGKRARRRDLARDARPQRGVDALKSAFPEADGRPDGVRDADEEP